MATKNLLVRGGADFSGLKKEMDKAQKQMSDFKQSMNNTLKSIGTTLATIGAGLYIKNAVTDAMRFEASIQQLNRLMGESSREFMKWASTTAGAFNMSKNEAVQYGATFSNIISTFAADTKQTQMYTQDLLQATAVAASMTGRSMNDALERVRSGMLGNTEAIEDLGIFVNVAMIQTTKAFKQFANGKSWDQLDFRTQQQIRLFAILEQAATKYGVEVGNNTLTATARFTAQLGNLKLAIGQTFKPMWDFVLPALTAFIGKLSHAMSVVAQFSQALFGKSTKTQQQQANATGEQAKAVDDLGDAYKTAGKKAKGSIAGFDEINSLADKSNASGAGVGTSRAMDPTAMSAEATGAEAMSISEKIKTMAESVKGFFSDVKNFMVEHKDIILAALGGIGAGLLTYGIAIKGAAIATAIWNGIVKASTALMAGLRAAMAFLLSPIGLIVVAVAGLVAAFIYFYRTNEKFRGIVDGVLNQIKDAALVLWNKALVPLGHFLKEHLTKIFNSLWQNVLVPFGEFLKASFKPTVEMLSAVFKYLWEYALKPLGLYLLELWNVVLKPLLTFLVGAFVSGIDKMTVIISDLIGGLKTTFIGLMDFITGVFTGSWEKAWEGVKGIFKGIFESLYAIVKNPLNSIINMINKVIDGLNKISIDIPDIPGLPGGGTTFGINIPKIPALAKGGITNGPTLALIGDNPGGKEVVSPLDDLTDMIASAVSSAVASAMQFSGGTNKNGEVVIQIDGTSIARAIGPYLNKENNRVGGTLIKTN